VQLTHDGVTAATIDASPGVANFLTDDDRTPLGTTPPRAYINYILLDEHFQVHVLAPRWPDTI
jgi:hypothetical protein